MGSYVTFEQNNKQNPNSTELINVADCESVSGDLASAVKMVSQCK